MFCDQSPATVVEQDFCENFRQVVKFSGSKFHFSQYNFDSHLKGTFRNAAINCLPSLLKRAGP